MNEAQETEPRDRKAEVREQTSEVRQRQTGQEVAPAWSSWVAHRWDVLAFVLASLLLYGATAAPSVATIFDDSLEFQVVLPTLGIAHPSGYPLYTLLGKLFILLCPGRDPAGRANLFSAVTAAVAVGLLYAAARRFAGSRPAAAVATLAFALAPAWWAQTTIAEVYALHGLLMMLFVHLLLRWEEATHETSNPTRQAWLLAAAAAVFGFGLAHHRMIVLLLPATLVFIAWTDPGLLRQPHRWLRPIGAGLAPLLLYLYLPLRGQATTSLDGTYVPTLAGTFDWVTARGYGIFLTANPFGIQRAPGFFVSLFLEQFGALLLLSALAAMATAWRLSRRRYLFLLLATAVAVAFGVAYKVQDVAAFFIPAFMLTALWAAVGLGPLFDSLQVYAAGLSHRLGLPRALRRPTLGGAALLLATIILVEPVGNAVREFDQRDRSRAWAVYDHGEDMLTHVAAGGRVVGLLGETTLLRYFRDVLGQRSDVTLIAADPEADRLAAVDAALMAGIPVYLTRDLPGAAKRYSLDAAGPLIAVSPKVHAEPIPSGQPIGAGIVLADVGIEVRRMHAGPVVRVTPTWAATQPLAESFKVSARLLAPSGQQLAQNDRVPVHFAYPTTAWTVGERVQDCYDLALPPDASDGFSVLLILYRAANGEEVGRVQLSVPTR